MAEAPGVSTTPRYTHVLYHSNCYDGFGAAWAAWLALGRNAEYLPVTHGDSPPDLPSDARVLIVDFSYPRDELLALRDSVGSLYVLDHHKTAEAALAGLDFAHFDMAHSGAYLSWRHFWPDAEVPAFVLLLEDRDLWRFELPGSREFNAALRSYPFDFETWADISEAGVDDLMAEGHVVLQHQDQMVEMMCEQAVWRDVGGEVVPVVNATLYFSEVGDALCRKFPGAAFAAYYLDRADGKRQWGMRSRNGFDVSEVAKMYGGGGHAAAAGFVTEVGEVLP